MQISDLLATSQKVLKLTGGELECHALNVKDIGDIIMKYQQQVLLIFSETPLQILTSAPDMVSDVIAMGSDTVGQEEDIKKLNVLDQVEIFASVIKLTFPDKKKIKDVWQLLKNVLPELPKIENDLSQETEKAIEKKTPPPKLTNSQNLKKE